MYFAFFLILFLAAGVVNFGYIEQMGTMVWHWPWVRDMLCQPGGVAEVLAMSLVQFFVYPWLGAVITAAVLALASFALYRSLARGTSATLYILSAFPATAIVFLAYNTNYMYSGVSAYLLMCLALWVTRRQWMIPVVATVLYLVAGPIAWAYLVCASLIAWRGGFALRKVYPTLVGAAVLMLISYICYRAGTEWKHALGADAYYTHRLQASFVVWMPWILAVGATLLSYVVPAKYDKRVSAIATNAFAAVALVGYAVFGEVANINRDNERFKALNLMVSNGDWDAIISEFAGTKANNLLYQNVLNLAYAERGVLGDSLFHHPVVDIRSIYQQGEKNPYISMLMSDVYYSMGHIGQAQRYAFESNEMLGNRSPRMLRRLVETNRLSGADGVADKYQAILDKTLYGTSKTPVDSLKNNVGITGRVGFPSLDTELKRVIRTHPDLQAPRQYLPALYLLSKDLPSFKQSIDSLYGPATLPVHFQEALLLTDVEHVDSVAAVYGIPDETVGRFRQFAQSPQSQRDTYWYFYRFTR